MQEGVDYIVAQDPESTDDSQWLVIINSGEWKDFIIKYNNIQIVDECETITYDLELILVSEKYKDLDVTEEMQNAFDEYCGDLIDHIMNDFHERGVNLYIDKETGEKIEY